MAWSVAGGSSEECFGVHWEYTSVHDCFVFLVSKMRIEDYYKKFFYIIVRMYSAL
jgi:hypothetical protein